MEKLEKSKPAEMYEQYFIPAIFNPWSDVLLSYARPNHGDFVLDLACGTCIITRKIAQDVGEEGKIVACDFNPDMLDVARSIDLPENISVEFRQENAVSLSLPDNYFDMVICQQGLQFFPDKEKAIHESQRVLKPSGRAIFAVWQSLNKHDVYKAMFEAEASFLGIDVDEISTPFSLGDSKMVKQLFSDAGYSNVNVIQHVKNVKFVSPEKFVELTLLAAASVIPDLTIDDPEKQKEMVKEVSKRIEPVLKNYRTNDYICFPMTSNIYVAVN
jgi:ubiquinone/menaquinone biosynthesis C-methylase UbiE